MPGEAKAARVTLTMLCRSQPSVESGVWSGVWSGVQNPAFAVATPMAVRPQPSCSHSTATACRSPDAPDRVAGERTTARISCTEHFSDVRKAGISSGVSCLSRKSSKGTGTYCISTTDQRVPTSLDKVIPGDRAVAGSSDRRLLAGRVTPVAGVVVPEVQVDVEHAVQERLVRVVRAPKVHL